MTRRWLHSADVEIDDESGALLVKIGGADLKIDVGDIDLGAIVPGITGTPDGKTLKDVVARLTDIAGYLAPLTLKRLTVVTVDSTTGGKTLATLLSVALDTGLRRLELVPETAGIYYATGDASSLSPSLEECGRVLTIQKAEADAL
jgi:hypothetical protein